MHLGCLEERAVAEAKKFATCCSNETIELGRCPFLLEDRDTFKLLCVAWNLDGLLDEVAIVETSQKDGHIVRHTDDGFVWLHPDVGDSTSVLLVGLRFKRSLVEDEDFAGLGTHYNRVVNDSHLRDDCSRFETLEVEQVMGT